jgi:DNA-directed RNA polymerase specialized sigma24 family protein
MVPDFLQQAEEVQDLTDEVFIKIFLSIKNLLQVSTWGTWIYRIAVTRSLGRLEKNQPRKQGSLHLIKPFSL